MSRDVPHRFTGPQQLERDMSELEGILEGIALDGRINSPECSALNRWCERHSRAASRPPYCDLVPLIRRSIEDGLLDLEERRDIASAISRLRTPSAYYNVATEDMQRLHGLLAGTAADGILNDDEISGISDWLEATTNLRGMWPYDEIDSLVTRALADGTVDDHERRAILAFCKEFTGDTMELLVHTQFDEDFVRRGVCAVDPEVSFAEHLFCFTGKTAYSTRSRMTQTVIELGGRATDTYNKNVDFLVLCSLGSAAWAFSIYGRKIEMAMNDRRSGKSKVRIIQEADFWDAVEDAGGTRP